MKTVPVEIQVSSFGAGARVSVAARTLSPADEHVLVEHYSQARIEGSTASGTCDEEGKLTLHLLPNAAYGGAAVEYRANVNSPKGLMCHGQRFGGPVTAKGPNSFMLSVA